MHKLLFDLENRQVWVKGMVLGNKGCMAGICSDEKPEHFSHFILTHNIDEGVNLQPWAYDVLKKDSRVRVVS